MLFIVLFTILIVYIPIGVFLMIMLYPYEYICVNNKICPIIHICLKTQIDTRFIKIILFLHSLITQMHEQLFIYIFANLIIFT